MSSRPLSVSVAAILLALFSLMNFPGPWWYLVPEAAEVTPMFVIYSGIVLGVVGLVAAVGLWMLKTWGFWLTIVVCVLNILLNASGLVMVLPGGLKALIAIQTIGFVLTLVLIVLPSTRRALATADQPFARKVSRVFRESAVPEARFPKRLPFYSVRQKR